MGKSKETIELQSKSGVLINQDLLSLIQAISQVDETYLSYADTNANADGREDQIIQLERIFAYELYHQWSLLKDEKLILNGEVDKLWNKETCYPDLVLHGGQDNPNDNKIVVEIKRECMVKRKPKAILDDLEKLSDFLETVEIDNQIKKYRNYDYAVFLLLKGELNEITKALKSKKATDKNLNDNIICMSYNEKGEIRLACLADLKR